MGRNRKRDKEWQNTLKDISESSRANVENTRQINEKLETNNKSKIPLYSLIVAVIALVVTISGYSVKSIIDGRNLDSGAEPTAETVAEPETGTKAETDVEEPEYTIYLYSEYNGTIQEYVETDITATLNFETDAVSITAYYESGGEDTVPLDRKNMTEWQKKVYFDRLGVHKIVAAATAPNGEVIENSIEVEVTPVSMDIDMDTINQFLPTGLQGVN